MVSVSIILKSLQYRSPYKAIDRPILSSPRLSNISDSRRKIVCTPFFSRSALSLELDRVSEQAWYNSHLPRARHTHHAQGISFNL